MLRTLPKTTRVFKCGAIAFLTIFSVSGTLFSQSYTYKGLELYNPHRQNVAFTGTDDLLQVDLLGYRSDYNRWIDGGAMVNIDRLNSTAGLSYTRWGTGSEFGTGIAYDPDIFSNSIRGVWAYHHHFSEDLVLNGALSFAYSGVEFAGAEFGGTYQVRTIRSAEGNVGASIYYKRARLGVSSDIPFMRKKEKFTAPGETVIQDMENLAPSFNLLASYGFGRKEGFYFEPVFSLDYWEMNARSNLQGYLGAKMMVRNWWGLGITMGNLVSVSTSVNILDRVELILGLYGGEHEVFSSMDYGNYFIGNNLEFIGQIRVKL